MYASILRHLSVVSIKYYQVTTSVHRPCSKTTKLRTVFSPFYMRLTVLRLTQPSGWKDQTRTNPNGQIMLTETSVCSSEEVAAELGLTKLLPNRAPLYEELLFLKFRIGNSRNPPNAVSQDKGLPYRCATPLSRAAHWKLFRSCSWSVSLKLILIVCFWFSALVQPFESLNFKYYPNRFVE